MPPGRSTMTRPANPVYTDIGGKKKRGKKETHLEREINEDRELSERRRGR